MIRGSHTSLCVLPWCGPCGSLRHGAWLPLPGAVDPHASSVSAPRRGGSPLGTVSPPPVAPRASCVTLEDVTLPTALASSCLLWRGFQAALKNFLFAFRLLAHRAPTSTLTYSICLPRSPHLPPTHNHHSNPRSLPRISQPPSHCQRKTLRHSRQSITSGSNPLYGVNEARSIPEPNQRRREESTVRPTIPSPDHRALLDPTRRLRLRPSSIYGIVATNRPRSDTETQQFMYQHEAYSVFRHKSPSNPRQFRISLLPSSPNLT